MRPPLFKVGDIVTPVNIHIKGEFMVVASAPAGTVANEDGYNVILNHRGRYKIYPRDEKKWVKV